MTDKRLLDILYDDDGCKMSEDNLTILLSILNKYICDTKLYGREKGLVSILRWNLYVGNSGCYEVIHIVFNYITDGSTFSDQVNVPITEFISEWREKNIDKVLN